MKENLERTSTLEKVRLIWFEDSKDFIDKILPFFENTDIEVIAVIKTIEEALNLLNELDDSTVDIALLDGNLVGGREEMHAWEILKLISDLQLNIYTIGFSSNKLPVKNNGKKIGVDKDIGSQAGPLALIDFIRSLNIN